LLNPHVCRFGHLRVPHTLKIARVQLARKESPSKCDHPWSSGSDKILMDVNKRHSI
jgi:hypothetical protein